MECLKTVKQGLSVDVNHEDFNYLTDAYVVKFCVARKFEPTAALAMMEQHISWRQVKCIPTDKTHFSLKLIFKQQERRFSNGSILSNFPPSRSVVMVVKFFVSLLLSCQYPSTFSVAQRSATLLRTE